MTLNADLFALPPNVSLSGRYKIHSRLGSFFSLLVCVVGIWLFIYLSRDMFDKTNPRLSQISSLGSTPVALDSEKNVLRFGFLNGYGTWGYLFDETYFSIEAKIYKGAIDNYHPATFTPISFGKCESVLYPGTDLICFKGYTAEGDPIVFGENADSVVFYFTKCDSSARSDCASDIDTVISASRLQWENYDYVVDLDNYKEPFGQAFAAKDDPLDANSLTIVTYQNRYTTINSYDGWILTSPSVNQRTTMWSKTASTTPIQSDGIFLKIEITKGGEHLRYYRQYPQIQNVLANVGGLLSLLMLVFRVLLLPYNKFIKQSLIVKSVYNVRYPPGPGGKSGKVIMSSDNENGNEEIEGHPARLTTETPMIQAEPRSETNFVMYENEDGNLDTPQSPVQSLPKNRRKIYPLEIDEPQSSISPSGNPSNWSPTPLRNRAKEDENVTIEIQEIKTKKKQQNPKENNNNQFDVGFLKWLWSFFKSQVEVEITKQGLKEVEGNIDILNIVKMKREINLLKQVLLSDSQRALFDNIQPPQISVDRNNKIEVENLQNHFEGDQLNAEEIYSKLSKLETRSHVDEKILAFYKKQK